MTAGSTWGATFAKARLIYSAVVPLAITYRAMIWAPTECLLQLANCCWIGDTLEHQQQGCLQTVTGGYKVTSWQQLEAEVAVPPLCTHITCLQLQVCAQMEASGVQAEIQCKVPSQRLLTIARIRQPRICRSRDVALLT